MYYDGFRSKFLAWFLFLIVLILTMTIGAIEAVVSFAPALIFAFWANH
jgi:hypothetical protein